MKIEPIGIVHRIDQDRSRIELDAAHAEGLGGLVPEDRLDVLYWMHELPEGNRRAMQVHPRGDKSRPKKGVFALRSPMRPNPIGVSLVSLVEIRHNDLVVQGLDANDGSPVIDIKAARRSVDTEQMLGMWGKVHHALASTLESVLDRQQAEHILRGPMLEAGRSAADKSRASASEIGRAILAIETLWGIEGRIIEDSPDQFTREVSTCPWSFFTPLGCEVIAWWMEGFVQGSNGEYNYSLDKSIPKGDAVCVWRIQRKRCPSRKLHPPVG